MVGHTFLEAGQKLLVAKTSLYYSDSACFRGGGASLGAGLRLCLGGVEVVWKFIVGRGEMYWRDNN